MSEAAERETVITWSDADNREATVYTAQRPLVTRLKKIRGAVRREVHQTESGEWTGETWQVPIAAILPRNPRRIGEAQRQAMRERVRVRRLVPPRPSQTGTRMARVAPKPPCVGPFLTPEAPEGIQVPPRRAGALEALYNGR
jgi:hypothetical protein